jgi:cytoskeleton protein RodZ
MTSERAEQPGASEQYHGIPGKALAAQREAMGWTVEQVADQLKLAVRQVIALEAGDYASLPSPAVTRGFVRAYAKIMKLDAAPLVAMIEMETPAPVDSSAAAVRREQKPASFSQSRFPSHGRRSSLPLGAIAGVLVVAAGAAAAWHFGLIPLGQHGESAPAGPAASMTVLPPPVTAVAGPAPAAPASSPETMQSASVPLISVPSPTTAASTPAAAAPVATGAARAPAAAGTTPATVPPAGAPATPAAAAGANRLVFTVHEDSWISVSPAKGGKPIVSHLAKAGSTETVDVTEPVKVVVGNAPGVSATLRGAPVELPGKTARIRLQ